MDALPKSTTDTPGTDYWRVVLLAGAIAGAAVAIVYAAGQALDVSMRVSPLSGDEMTVGAGLAVGEALLASLVGGVLAWLLARRSMHSRGIFVGIALVVFVLLSISAATAGDDGGTIAVLLLMHIAVLVPTLVLVAPRIGGPR